MTTTRRTFLTASGATLFPAFDAFAQSAWPTKPIRFVVPFAPGGSSEIIARTVAGELSKTLGQNVFVDNKPGASGNIAMAEVAHADDQHTLILGHIGTLAVNPYMYDKIPYDPNKDFKPVSLLAKVPSLYVVNANLPVQNLKDFIALAKSKPGQLNYGSAGNGGISHLVPEMFKTATGLFMVHIPYRGSAPAFTDLMGGQVQFMAESIPQAAAYHKQGKVKALAVTSRERNAALPEVPTAIESGLKEFEVVGFYGFLAPANLPREVSAKLSDAFRQVLGSAEIRGRMTAQGADPAFLGSEDFAKYLAAEMPRWAEAVKKSGARMD